MEIDYPAFNDQHLTVNDKHLVIFEILDEELAILLMEVQIVQLLQVPIDELKDLCNPPVVDYEHVPIFKLS